MTYQDDVLESIRPRTNGPENIPVVSIRSQTLFGRIKVADVANVILLSLSEARAFKDCQLKSAKKSMIEVDVLWVLHNLLVQLLRKLTCSAKQKITIRHSDVVHHGPWILQVH